MTPSGKGPPDPKLEDLELRLLLEAIQETYGYDFRGYARASLHRRVVAHIKRSGHAGIAELIPAILRDPAAFSALLLDLTVTVTEMFRDPAVYRTLRQEVIPWLKTFPFTRIWHAGCATGEEVYSLAILLEEEGLLDRVQIYATDLNPVALEHSKRGIYSVKSMRESTRNYQAAGGKAAFSDYFYAEQGSVAMQQRLRDRVVFSRHNLVTDRSFGEMHLILCRNVLIYFSAELQERARELFGESLVHKGYLCLGSAETIDPRSERFDVVDADQHLFRRGASAEGAGPR